MKKYFFSILAIVLAVGFSAFTSKTPAKKAPATFTDFYWFDVSSIDQFGNIIPQSSPEFSGTMQSHSTAADPLQNATGCDDTPNRPPCIGGYPESKVNLQDGVAISVKTDQLNPNQFEQPDDIVLENQ